MGAPEVKGANHMELVFNLIIGIFLLVLLALSTNFGGMKISTDKIGPGGFPQMVIVISLILLAMISYNSYKERGKRKKGLFDIHDKGLKIMLLNIGLFGVYIFTLNYLGFIIGTLLFGIASLWNMGYKGKAKGILFVLILTLSITLIFGRVFYIALPRGLGILRELSYLIY